MCYGSRLMLLHKEFLQNSANMPNVDYVHQLKDYERAFPVDAHTLLLPLVIRFITRQLHCTGLPKLRQQQYVSCMARKVC